MVGREQLDIECVLSSYEAIFKLNGGINQHNCVYWVFENLKDTIVNRVNLERVCVWQSISSEGIVAHSYSNKTVPERLGQCNEFYGKHTELH